MAMDTSVLVAFLAKTVPGLLKKESINKLVADNKLSFESANEAIHAIESNGDSTAAGAAEQKQVLEKLALNSFLADTKFKAELIAVQEDDRFLYEEFQRVDNERDKIIAKIAEKQEATISIMLQHLSTIPGSDIELIKSLQGLKLKVQNIK